MEQLLAAREQGCTASQDNAQSALKGLIPQFVGRRLSPLRSLREIATAYVRPQHHRWSSYSSSSSSTDSAVPPPPPYSEEPPSSDDEDMDADYASAPSSRPSTSGSSTPRRRSAHLTLAGQVQAADELTRFKFANQGLLLAAQSMQELRANPHSDNEYQRRLYLDGMSYLLRALPEDLSDTEQASLQAAMPTTLREQSAIVSEEQVIEEPEVLRSLLHSTVSLTVFWMFFFIATATPYIKLLLRSVLALERKHKVGAQCLAYSLALVQITYNQLFAWLCALWAMNDGIIGRTLTEAGIWCAQNVSDGVRDGLKDAAAALRAQDTR